MHLDSLMYTVSGTSYLPLVAPKWPAFVCSDIMSRKQVYGNKTPDNLRGHEDHLCSLSGKILDLCLL